MKRILCILLVLVFLCSCTNNTVTELSESLPNESKIDTADSEVVIKEPINKEQTKIIFIGYKNIFYSNSIYSGIKSVYEGEIIRLDIIEDKDYETLSERIEEVTSQNNISAIICSTGAVIDYLPHTNVPVFVFPQYEQEYLGTYEEFGVDGMIFTPSYIQYNDAAAQIIKQQDCNIVGTVYGAGGTVDYKYIYNWESLKKQLSGLECAEPVGNAHRTEGLAEEYISDTNCDCLYLLSMPEVSLPAVSENMFVIAADTHSRECIDALIDGKIDCVIQPDYYNIGELAGWAVNDIIDGKTVDSKIITEPLILQTAQEAQDYIAKVEENYSSAS